MVKIDGVSVNITEELKEVLRQNPAKTVKKAVISKVKDDKGDIIQATDEDGNPKFTNAIASTHPNVYFDEYGNFYLRAFKTKVIEYQGKKIEVIVTNPKIPTEKDCKLYGKGVVSHRQEIPGSELWDNGRTDLIPHTEVVCKGDPMTLIIKVMSAEEVLAVDLKPKGENIISSIANMSHAEKATLRQYLNEGEEE